MPEDGARIVDDTDSQLNDTVTTRNDVSVQLDETDAVPETAEPTGDGEQVDDTSSLHTLSQPLPSGGLSTDLEFSRLESWSRDISRPVFTSLGLGLEPRNLGLGLGTLQSQSRSWDLRQWRLGFHHS